MEGGRSRAGQTTAHAFREASRSRSLSQSLPTNVVIDGAARVEVHAPSLEGSSDVQCRRLHFGSEPGGAKAG